MDKIGFMKELKSTPQNRERFAPNGWKISAVIKSARKLTLDDDKKIKIQQGNTTIVVGERKPEDDNETVEELPEVDDAGEGEVTEDE